jgi:hypothetical protein
MRASDIEITAAEKSALQWMIGQGHADADADEMKQSLLGYYCRTRPIRPSYVSDRLRWDSLRRAATNMFLSLERKGLLDRGIGVTMIGRRAAQ